MSTYAKADADRAKQRGARNKQLIAAVKQIIKDYRQGRAASACMHELELLFKD